MSATAVIQIIGIFLVSYQIAPGGLVAVAPRIPCSQTAQQTETILAGAAEEAMMQTGVEEHVALLLIPPCDFISSSGWTPQLLQTNKQVYLYVKLDGERIHFIANSPSNISAKRVSDDLGLPHVFEKHCCEYPALRPEYMPPDYRLAAAVLDLSNGHPSACLSSKRTDTIVTIENGGTLTVEATNGSTTKQITVTGSGHVIFANVPIDAIPGTQPCGGGKAHYLAYGAMVQACDTFVDCPVRQSSSTSCEDQPVVKTLDFNGHRFHTPVIPAIRIDANCSNNQWP